MKLKKFKFETQSGPREARDWWGVAEWLEAHPGKWYASPYPANAVSVTAVNQGRLKAFRPAGVFEARIWYGEMALRYVSADPDAPNER